MSATVIVAVHVSVFPEASFTVMITEFAPLFEQLNVVLLSVIIKFPAIVQLSEDPLFTSFTVNVATPELFKNMVGEAQTAVGAWVSEIITSKLQALLMLPVISVAV